ncbi:MAG: hypothetical protein JXO72_11675 [Vicinamibacteria bacterium]|nr:hypothetical protein [Vicinamibacteria bacterium]
MKPVNLATRPLRNQRPWILLVVCANLSLLVLTAIHFRTALRLRPRETAEARLELARIDRRLAEIQAESRALDRRQPAESTMGEWAIIRDLVDARMFDWVDLFARLGESLPEGTRLLSITPSVKRDVVSLSLEAVARSPETMFETVRMLEARSEFEDVYMANATAKDEGVASRLELVYRPPVSADSAETVPTEVEERS